jgi:hypothetical protein
LFGFVCLMVINATSNNISVISWQSVVLVEETGWPGENHRPVASHWQTLSHNIVHLALLILTVQHINSPKSSSKSHSVQHSSFQLIHDRIMNRKLLHLSIKGALWPWFYGSWIYNAISAYHHWCGEFESRSGRGVQHYVITFVSNLWQVCGFLRVLSFPP